MTQEELDSLMKDDANLNELDKEVSTDETNESSEEVSEEETKKGDSFGEIVEGVESESYKIASNIAWPPPPPNPEHKVVHQLDDVTKDSEEKAIEMMDRLEHMNGFFSQSEKMLKDLEKIIKHNQETFKILHEKFPNVQTFADILEENVKAFELQEKVQTNLQQGQDEILVAMDSMQYQDIHRQKIERVINVMRALTRYMNSLFEGRIDDSKRVSSAVHIDGDTTENVVSNDDIEALIASLGQKK